MYDRISSFSKRFLTPLLCGYRKEYSSQHALLQLLDSSKLAVDQGGYAGALMVDLSKAFDCIDHELLIAKLHAYRFSRDAILQIYSYLANRRQRVEVNGVYCTWKLAKTSEYHKDRSQDILCSTFL